MLANLQQPITWPTTCFKRILKISTKDTNNLLELHTGDMRNESYEWVFLTRMIWDQDHLCDVTNITYRYHNVNIQ